MAKKALKISQNKLIIRLFLGFFLVVSLFMTIVVLSPKTFADVTSSGDDQTNYIEVARHRNYPGGADEEDLKVLPELPNLKNKKQKTEESAEGF